MTAVQNNLENLITPLHIYVKKTDLLIKGQNSEAIEQHLQTLGTILETVNHLTLEVEAQKIESEVDSDALQTWNDDVDSKLQAADVKIGKIRKCIRDHEKGAEITILIILPVNNAHFCLVKLTFKSVVRIIHGFHWLLINSV